LITYRSDYRIYSRMGIGKACAIDRIVSIWIARSSGSSISIGSCDTVGPVCRTSRVDQEIGNTVVWIYCDTTRGCIPLTGGVTRGSSIVIGSGEVTRFSPLRCTLSTSKTVATPVFICSTAHISSSILTSTIPRPGIGSGIVGKIDHSSCSTQVRITRK